MKEIKSIIEEYHRLNKEGLKMAMAIVVHVEDSSYRRSGARMLISEDGQWTGGVSGGCLEGDILNKAQHALYENRSVVVRYDTREGDDSQIGVGLGCRGLIDVLIIPLSDDSIISQLEKQVDQREASIKTIVIQADNNEQFIGKHFEYTDEQILRKDYDDAGFVNELCDDIYAVKESKRSLTKDYQLFTADGLKIRIFIEYHPPTRHLFIFGKNYDTLPLARIAKELGWKVTIASNPLKVSKKMYGVVDVVSTPLKALANLDEHSAALLMSHDFKTDKNNLELIADQPLSYIGLLGPKKRLLEMCNELPEVILRQVSKKLYGPIGLDTGATTPEGIAVSILAEITAHFNNREGGFLRDRGMPVNDRGGGLRSRLK